MGRKGREKKKMKRERERKREKGERERRERVRLAGPADKRVSGATTEIAKYFLSQFGQTLAAFCVFLLFCVFAFFVFRPCIFVLLALSDLDVVRVKTIRDILKKQQWPILQTHYNRQLLT